MKKIIFIVLTISLLCSGCSFPFISSQSKNEKEIKEYILRIEKHIKSGERTLSLSLAKEASEKYDNEILQNIYNVLIEEIAE